MIKIPFREEFREPMLKGQKTATSRTEKYGDVGDTFTAFDALFEITSVHKLHLGTIAKYHFKVEGVASPEAFKQKWAEIHPRKGFDAEQQVFIHFFRRLKKA